MKRRMISLLLCLCMVLTLLPTMALAADGSSGAIVYTTWYSDSYLSLGGISNNVTADQTLCAGFSGGTLYNSGVTAEKLNSISVVETEAVGSQPAEYVIWYSGCSNGTISVDGDYIKLLGFSLKYENNSSLVPVPAGTYYFKLYIAKDSGGELEYLCDYSSSPERIAAITVESSEPSGPSITTESLSNGVIQTAYSQTLAATPVTDGKAITWSVTSGSLPAGLTLAESSGVISGTPTAAGISTFTVQASEADGSTSTKQLSITITRPTEAVTWSTATLTLSTPRKGAAATYTFAMKPDKAFTPVNGTQIAVTVSGVDFSGKTVTVTSPAGGVTVSTDGSTITLSFNGTAEVTTAAGLAFSVASVTNPGANGLTPSSAAVTYAGSTKDVTVSARTFGSVSLTDRPSLTVSVLNWDAVKDMQLILRVEKSGVVELTHYGLSSASCSWPLPASLEGQSATVTLLARDAAYTYHTLSTASFTGDADTGNTITLTANATKVMPYTLSVSPDGVTCSLEQGGSYLTPYNGKYWLASTDDLTVNSISFSNDSLRSQYNKDAASVAVNDSAIQVTLPAFEKTAGLSGTVKDGSNPLMGAVVTVSQLYNGKTTTISTVTNKAGAYSVTGLAGGVGITVSAALSGYSSSSATVSAGTKDFTLAAVPTIQVLLADGKTAQNPQFSLYDASGTLLHTQSGSGGAFLLQLQRPANGSVTVTMEADNFASSVTGTATISSGSAVVTLDPTLKGWLDWSGVYAADLFNVNAFRVFVFQNDLFLDSEWGYQGRMQLPAGTYTVYLVKNDAYWSALTSDAMQALVTAGDATAQNVTVPAGGTIQLPTTAHPGSITTAVGTVTGPDKAGTGEMYRVSGVIEGPAGLTGLEINTSFPGTVQAVVINGGKALTDIAIQTARVTKNQNPTLDWSLPLSYTVYCTQDATKVDRQQAIAISVLKGSKLFVGSARTEWTETLTIETQNVVGAQATGVSELWQPGTVSFSGNAPANVPVSLYDNGTLCAIVHSDAYGRYSGTMQLTSGAAMHTLRAEATYNGSILSATDTLLYDPSGAELTELWMNSSRLDLSGRATAVSMTPGTAYNLKAVFSHGERLENTTATVNGVEKTGKVFFRVSTVGGVYVIPATGSGNTWTASNCRFGVDYPTGVTVLYQSAAPVATEVTIGSDKFTLDGVFGSTGSGDVTKPGVYDWAGLTDQFSASQQLFSLRSESADAGIGSVSLMANGGDSSGLFESLAASLGSGFAPLTVSDAAANAATNYEYRTYFDNPGFSASSLTFKVREFQQKGYEGYSYTDDTTGKQYLAFIGTFYYGRDALPVPTLYVERVDGGIQKMVEDPRILDNGIMIGSTLQVVYAYDVSAGTWSRMQGALIPPGAKSPIHTTKSQIPCKTDAPYSYTPASLYSVRASEASSEESAPSARLLSNAPGDFCGIRFAIDPTKVRGNTYAGAVTTILTLGAGQAIKAKNYVVQADPNLQWWNYTTIKTEATRR